MKAIEPNHHQARKSIFIRILKWPFIIFISFLALGFLFDHKRLVAPLLLAGIGFLIYKYIIKPRLSGVKVGLSNAGLPNFGADEESLKFSINGATKIENPFAGVFISGGAGSGKSKSLIEPLIKESGKKGYTGVIYDFKFPELAQYVASGYRSGEVKPYYINFKDLSRSNRINPIAPNLMINDSYAREFAYTILVNLNPQMISKPDFWSDNATSLLTSVFWYLRERHPDLCTLPHAISMILQPDLNALLGTLSQEPKCADMISPILTAFANGADNQLAGVLSSLQVSLSKINTDEIYYLLTQSDFSLELNNSESKGVLVIGNEPTLSSTYSPIIGLILASASKQLNRQGKEKSVFMIDEFPTVYIPNIEQLPATARSNKVATILACQDIAQLYDRYGKEKSETILSNLGNQFYGRTPNPTTAERVSKIFGKAEVRTISYSRDQKSILKHTQSSTESLRETDLVKLQDVAQLNTGQFYTILSEGKNRQGLSSIPMDKSFVKAEIPAFRTISPNDLKYAYTKVKNDMGRILVTN